MWEKQREEVKANKMREGRTRYTFDSGVEVTEALCDVFVWPKPGKQSQCQVAVIICWSAQLTFVDLRLRVSKHFD